MRKKKWLLRGILFLTSIIITLTFIEIALHFYPVQEIFYHLPLNEDNPVTRYEPNQTLTWSRFSNMSIVNTLRLNNYGFNNRIDYVEESPLPLIAVIGDSYIEALIVPLNETGHALLADKLEGKARVYSFGASNVSLCGYSEYAKWAKGIFHPDKIIILIIANDFDSSLIKYGKTKYQNFYKEDKNGGYSIVRIDHKRNPLRVILAKSKLISFLWLNCHIKTIPRTIKMKFSSEEEDKLYVGNVIVNAEPERIMDSQKVIDYFLETLPENSGLTEKDILFVVDGFRPFPYTDQVLEFRNNSYFGIMRKYFMKSARKKGYEVIDLNPIYQDDFKKNGKKFTVIGDGHWNSRGQLMFFNAIYGSDLLKAYR